MRNVAPAFLCASFAALILTACATSDPANVQVIQSEKIGEVVDDMKRQVSVFVGYQNSDQGRAKLIAEAGPTHCGYGLVDFDIKTVKLTLLTSVVDEAKFSATLSPIPAGSALVGGGVYAARNTTNLQELTFVSELQHDDRFRYPKAESLESAPIAAVLINLRSQLIKAGRTPDRVCFKTSPGTNGENSYKLAVTIINKGGGNVGLGLAPMDLALNGESASTTGNTMTVTFVPHAFSAKELGGLRHVKPVQRGSSGEGANVWNDRRVNTREEACALDPKKCTNVWGHPGGLATQ